MFWVGPLCNSERYKCWPLFRFGHSTSSGMSTIIPKLAGLIVLQRTQTWSAYSTKDLATTLYHPHTMADPGVDPPLPLHCAEPWEAAWPRMPRTTRKPLHTILLPRNMGHNSDGCGILVCHADTAEVVEGPC